MTVAVITGIVYAVGKLLENIALRLFREASSSEETVPGTVRISAAGLGLELTDHSSAFQSRYFMRRIHITGTVTSLKLLHTPGGKESVRHRVELDGVIVCEFVSEQDWAWNGVRAEISGICMGRILTSCRLVELQS